MTPLRTKWRTALAAAVAAGVALIAAQLPLTATGTGSRTYTLDADFDEGTYSNVVHSTPDQLQLDETTTPFGFIWVAVSTKGTAVKIDTDTGAIIGEYRTTPEGVGFGDPSRTTVDKNGNVWVGNRARGSFVKIGLLENNQCVDRNGNGTIETSGAQNDIKPWPGSDVTTAQDECVLLYTQTANSDGRHVSVDANNDVWVSGFFARIFQKLDGDTGAILDTQGPVGFGGYGGLMDANGVIWSARSLLRWDVANPLSGPNGGNWTGYFHDSYGLCIDSQGNVWNTSLSGSTIRKFNPAGAEVGSHFHGNTFAQGCVIDANDHVWVAHSILGPQSTVGHLLPDGTWVGNVAVGSGPTGVAVDRSGKIWATNYFSATVSRIDPNAGAMGGGGVPVGAVDFTTVNLGGNPYNYSDMTGSTLIGAPNSGTWTVVHDSAEAATEWGTVSWNAELTGDGSIAVNVASSEDGVTFSAASPATNGADVAVPDGRYLRISVVFTRASSGESPILFDLSVRPANEPPTAVCQDVTVGNDAAACSAAVTPAQVDGGSTDPDGDALTLTVDPAGPYPVGSTNVELTVTDPSGESDSCAAVVTVNDEDGPAITCPAPITVECAGPDGARAAFSAEATDNCSVFSVTCAESGNTFGLGTHNVSCSASDASGNSSSCSTTVTVVDTGMPAVACVPSHNPSGKNIPGGSNEDGFYRVSASDGCSAAAALSIQIGGIPLAQGETFKITQSPGASGATLVGTMGPLAIKHVRVGPADAVITVTDGSGNSSSVACLVAPPPK